jgi:hypothetical protein
MCVLLFIVSSAVATTSQGLEWGIVVEDHFDFHFRYTDYAEPVYSKTFDFYFEVVSLPVISDSISAVQGIPYLNITTDLDFYYTNSTALGTMSAMLPKLVLPIGNWALWTTLLENVIFHEEAEYSLIDASESSSTWSYLARYGGNDMFSGDGTATYLKDNGVLTYYNWVAYNEAGSPIYEYEISRVGCEPVSLVFILGLGGIGLVVVIVIVLFAKKRSSRVPI